VGDGGGGGVPGVVVVLLVLFAIGAAIGIAFAVRRHRYKKALREKGWHFDPSPSPAIANGLLVPPFGLGFSRGTDEQVAGRTRAGVDFQVFEYAGANNERVLCMRLPLALPELVITAGTQRPGVLAPVVAGLGPGEVRADDVEFARLVSSALQAPLSGLGGAPLSLAVDGDQLTVVGAPKDPDELERYLEAHAPLAQAIGALGPQLEPFRRPGPPRRIGFYRRPSWEYRESEDELLQTVAVTGGGQNHRTKDVVHGEFYPGCFFVAFEHHWQTTRTVTTSDGRGGTTTRTETDNHQETIHEIALPFSLPDLEVTNDSRLGRLFGGGTIDFESSAFNDAFDVRSSSAKFAHDVIHPRQMEYLLSIGPRPFTITSGRVRLHASAHTPDAIGFELGVMAGFFARIPSFVWQDLGVPQPPLRLSPDGGVEVVSG
jgi:hypothetical protein